MSNPFPAWLSHSQLCGVLHSTGGRKVLVDQAISVRAPQSLCADQGSCFKKGVGAWAEWQALVSRPSHHNVVNIYYEY